MAKYRKRTPTVEAVRLTGLLPSAELHAFLGSLDNVRIGPNGRGIVISTPQGDLPVPDGNWIIKDADGRLTATDPASFEAQFEPVKEQTDGN